MSVDNHDDRDESNKTVTDEEGTVDQKIKNRILNARERVDHAEQRLYIEAPADGSANINEIQQLQGFATIVRQYVRNLRPLLTSDEIEQADHYWRNVRIFDQMFAPPDTAEIPWSNFASDQFSNAKLKRTYGFSPGFEPPESKRFEIAGLQDILNKQAIELYWQFDKNQGQNLAVADSEELEIVRPLPKSVYEQAVEYADEFLQIAGVGLEIGHEQMDDKDRNPF